MCYGIQLADLPKNRNNPTARFHGHPFDRAWRRHGIGHRLTKPSHPWTNGQGERMNRTLKDATVPRYHSVNHVRLHRDTFVHASGSARRFETLRWLTPLEPVVRCRTEEPRRFIHTPTRHVPGLNL